MLDTPRIGPDDLPGGWQRPTKGLVKEALRNVRLGLALTSARHLLQRSQWVGEEQLADPSVIAGIEALKATVDPAHPASLNAVGMAWPQLDRAREHNLSIFAMNVGLPNIHGENRTSQIEIFTNPQIRPIEGGSRSRREHCKSVPGVAVILDRWWAIEVTQNGGEPQHFEDTDAWIIQHEADHLRGILCPHQAIVDGRPLYFAPPEWRQAFFRSEHVPPDWPTMPVEQFEAMLRGEFSLLEYRQYIKE